MGSRDHRHPLPGPLHNPHRAQHAGQQQCQPEHDAKIDASQPRT
jgi:hypothetical protein